MTTQQHIANTLRMSSRAEMLAYFRAQHFDYDDLYEYIEVCNEEAEELQYCLDYFGTPENDNGCWTYGSADKRYDELLEQTDEYKTMAEIAEEYYDELDNE